MLDADSPAVVAIERACTAPPWSEADFLAALRRPYHGAYVAVEDGKILGFWVQELTPGTVHIKRLAVHPAFRRLGVGRQMVVAITGRLAPGGRTRATATVPETELVAQVFLRSCGFLWTETIRGEGGGRDSYIFQYVIEHRRETL